MSNATPDENDIQELLAYIRPWFDRDTMFLVDSAKVDWAARLAIAAALRDSGHEQPAQALLASMAGAPAVAGETQERESARVRAMIELADLYMDQIKYDEAEPLLWQVREHYREAPQDDYLREDISLLIAQCRFGQGFVQEAIDRAEEVLRKLQAIDAGATMLAKTHQQLGWFQLHKMNVPAAMSHMKTAMKLAPELDQALVEQAVAAESQGRYEEALQLYFDAIRLEVAP